MTNVKIKGHIYSSKAPFLFENLQFVINLRDAVSWRSLR